MQIFRTPREWQAFRREISKERTLGFVPTMGNLHAGHASLFTASQRENNLTAVSLFINPTQFNQRDDFLHYPRTLDTDLALLQELGIDFCLLPEESELYADKYRYQVHENLYSQRMEGAHRPGHFTGVLTVVLKLLNLVSPHRAYFGEKDYQQLELIRDMVSSLFIPVEIKACPTIRETNGLAYSSRNRRLNPAARKLAEQFAGIFHQGESCEAIVETLRTLGIQVDYVEEHDDRRFAAVIIDGVRLIDNYPSEQQRC